jgi:hypothetical protein
MFTPADRDAVAATVANGLELTLRAALAQLPAELRERWLASLDPADRDQLAFGY